MTYQDSTYFRYWGKARKPGDEQGPAYHLLPYHCLDVAAVGKIYLESHDALCAGWAARLNIPSKTLISWSAFFLALHDLGKFSYRFQGLRKDICRKLNNEQKHRDYSVRHDTLGQAFFDEKISRLIRDQEWFGSTDEPDYWMDHFVSWARTVTGHHGQPPKTSEYCALNDHFTELDQSAALQFVQDCVGLLLPEEKAELPEVEAFCTPLTHLSWWLSGLAVLSDWLGSSQSFFDYQTEPLDLTAYWTTWAVPQAEKALHEVRLLPRTGRQQTLLELFEYLKPATPLQNKAADLPLQAAPHLFIMEDVTGAGKTEAALMLAHRLIMSGQADGFYLGLPTMATSNAMFRRICDNEVGRKFFVDEPNLLLAHSASRLEPVLQALTAHSPVKDADYLGDEASASNECNAWFTDNRKKTLLADIGVGTLDQALLAVLYGRHQSLRLLGLVRKVLIIDEVHACDAYMLRLLEVLLEFHAAIGGSVILLSATLPRKTRQTLLHAYAKGLRRRAPAIESMEYPLLTWLSVDTHDEIPLDTRPEVARTVHVKEIHNMDAAVKTLLNALANNQCACWIRNTVDDAIAACKELRQAGVPAENLMLFHARFALYDRLQIENEVLRQFGPKSNGIMRRGKILVATQVVEQSLDLDFDMMLSDLAPIDLLIQRAGRLCRHRRDALGNRADTEGRCAPCLWVFGPKFSEEPASDWLRSILPGAAAVYPNHGQMWLTARLVHKDKVIVMPKGARDLIEGVYSEEAEDDIPIALRYSVTKAIGENAAKQSMAGANTVKLDDGYSDQGFAPWDEALIPTRLEDQPSVTVRLARLEGGILKPWQQAEQYAWELSQLSVRYSLFSEEISFDDDPVMQAAMENCRAGMPDEGKWNKLLVLMQREDGVWTGRAKNGKGDIVELCYDKKNGLRRVC
jgi:CRISPR-associated endonuclease/helicase Cas3